MILKIVAFAPLIFIGLIAAAIATVIIVVGLIVIGVFYGLKELSYIAFPRTRPRMISIDDFLQSYCNN